MTPFERNTSASTVGLPRLSRISRALMSEMMTMERELARSSASVALEEQKHAKLPPQVPIASPAEHDQRFGAAVTEYMAFLKDHDVLTIRPDMEPGLRAHLGTFSPGPREFFGEVDARDPEIMRTHGYHWFDKGWMANVGHPSPIRKVPQLYNIFNTRTEGFATAFEIGRASCRERV